MLKVATKKIQTLTLSNLKGLQSEFDSYRNKSPFQKNSAKEDSLLASIAAFLSKLQTLTKIYPYAIQVDKNDLFCHDTSSPRHANVKHHIICKALG